MVATSKKRACVGDRWCLCCMVGPPCLLEGSRVSTIFGDNNYRLQSWCIRGWLRGLCDLGKALSNVLSVQTTTTPRAPFPHWGIIEWLPSLPFTSLSEYVAWFLRQATMAPQRHSLLRGVFIGGQLPTNEFIYLCFLLPGLSRYG